MNAWVPIRAARDFRVVTAQRTPWPYCWKWLGAEPNHLLFVLCHDLRLMRCGLRRCCVQLHLPKYCSLMPLNNQWCFVHVLSVFEAGTPDVLARTSLDTFACPGQESNLHTLGVPTMPGLQHTVFPPMRTNHVSDLCKCLDFCTCSFPK